MKQYCVIPKPWNWTVLMLSFLVTGLWRFYCQSPFILIVCENPAKSMFPSFTHTCTCTLEYHRVSIIGSWSSKGTCCFSILLTIPDQWKRMTGSIVFLDNIHAHPTEAHLIYGNGRGGSSNDKTFKRKE